MKKIYIHFFSLLYSSTFFATDWNVNADGFWNVNGNWTPTTFPNSIDAIANFPNIITATRTISLGSGAQNITVGTLNINTPGGFDYNLAPGFAGNTLIFEVSSGTAQINFAHSNSLITTPIILNSTLVMATTTPSVGTPTFQGGVSGTGGLTINNRVEFEAHPNTYTGLTMLNSGSQATFAKQAFGGDLVSSGSIEFVGTDQIPHNATVTLLDSSFTLFGVAGTYIMGSLNYLGGVAFPDEYATLTFTSSGTALTMRNTSLSGPIFLTGGGNIVFDNTNNSTALINGSLDLGGFTTALVINNGTAANDMIISAAISNGGLVKQGAGNLSLTGANTYASGTLISAGTLQGNTSSIQGNITNNASLLFDQSSLGTYTGTISGTGTVEKQGAGTLILTGPNTYGGGTLITAGTLQGNTTSLQGNVTDNANLIFNQSGTGTYSGLISGTGTVQKQGVGTLTLTNANLYTGLTTITAGELLLNASGTNAIAGDVSVNGGTLALGATNQIPDTSTITVSNGTFNLGGFTETVARLNLNAGGILSQGGAVLNLNSSDTALSMQNTTISGNLALTGGGAIAFDNTNNGTATINGNIDLGGNATDFNIANGTGTDMIINGIISNGGVVKTGGGILTLAGANTYTGDTIIMDGELQGNITNIPGDVVTQGTLTLDQTTSGSYNGVISGTGDLVKQGAGTLTLTNTNTYTGMTIVSSGELLLDASGNAISGDVLVDGGTLTVGATNQIPNTSTVTVSNGTFDLNGSAETIATLNLNSGGTLSQGGALLSLASANTALSMQDVAISGNIALTGGGAIVFDNTNNGTATISGNLNLGGFTPNFDIANGTAMTDMSVDGIMSNGGLTKAGAGTLTLTGANTYTGLTTVTAGELLLNASGTNAVRGNILVNGGTLGLGSANQILDTSTVGVSNGTFDLGGFAETIGTLSLNSGGILSQGGALLSLTSASTALSMQNTTISGNVAITNGGSVVFDNANNGTATINGNINLNNHATAFNIANGTAPTDMIVNGLISNGGMTKTGLGTLVLMGANTYTGGTTVSGGILQGNTTSIQGNILNNATVVFDQASPGVYNNAISGTGTLIKQGAGVLTLAGTNTYVGGTLISAGTLQGNTNGIQGNITNNAALIFNQVSLGTHTGMISGTGNVEKQGIGTLILTGTNTYTGGTLVSAGTLQGNASSLQGNITNNTNLIFNQTSTGNYLGQISGSGNFVKQGSGNLILSNSNSVGGTSTVSQGILTVNGTLSGGGSLFVAQGAELEGTGTIIEDCTVSGTLAPGNSIGTIHLVGIQTMTSGSSLSIEIDPTTSDLVDVIGSFTLQPGVTLNVIPLPGIYHSPSVYTIVQTTGGVTGTFSNTPSLPLFHATPIYSAFDIMISVEQSAFSTLFSTGNAGAVAKCLDALAASSCSNQSDIIGSLANLPTESAVKEALLQMQPSAFTSLAVAQENDLFYLRNALYNRMEMPLHSCCFENEEIVSHSVMQTLVPETKIEKVSNKKKKSLTIWLTGLGAHTSQKNHHEEPGFMANSPGVFMGIDAMSGKRSCYGGGLGYTHTHLHWWEKRGNANIDAIYGTLYGRWASPHAYMQGSLIGGYSFYSIHRNIAFGTVMPIKETAKSHHNGLEGSAHFRMGFNYGCQLIAFSPFIGVDYFYVHENAFHERGAKSLNLKVKTKNSNLLSSEAGVDLSHCFGSKQKTFAPFVKLSVIRENRFKGSKEKASLECGCDFTVSGLYPNRTLAGVAAGFNANIQNNTLSLFYQGKFKSSYNDNSWYLQYSFRF